MTRGQNVHNSLMIGLRAAADGLMMLFALAIGVVVMGLRQASPGSAGPLASLWEIYAVQALLLLIIAMAVLRMRGFYGRNRFRPLREKSLNIVEGVTLAFALYGCVQILPSFPMPLSLGAFILAFVLTLTFLLAARLWANLSRTMILAESSLLRKRTLEQQPKRILVIGGGGYIGSALLPQLLEAGYQVRLLDLLLFGDEAIKPFLDHPALEVVRSDYRQVDQLVRSMQGVDTVVHLGGLVGDPACSVDEDLTVEVNLDYTRIIAEVAKGSGVGRFVFASSCSVYGASDELLDESSSLNPVSLYARSKITSENVLFEMSSPDFAPTMMRFGTIYGLSGRTRFDLVVNLLSAKACIDGKITVFGGDQWRPFVHVEDAAKAMLLAVAAPVDKVRNQIFNVGSDEQNATLGQVGRLIQRLIPDAEYIDSGQDGDRRNYRVRFDKIREMLGFEPSWTLEQGVLQVAEAVRSDRVTDYRDASHSNVRFLTEGSAGRYARVRSGWAKGRIAGDVTHSMQKVAAARFGGGTTVSDLAPSEPARKKNPELAKKAGV